MEQKDISPSYYLKVGDDSGVLEFDLITFRQKGKEEKYLSVTFSGINLTQEPPVPQESFVNIDEAGFKAIKEFFTQLEWSK